VKAIVDVFGEHAYNVNISSTKSMTGHCLGAAGVIEAIACIKAVMHISFHQRSIILPMILNWIHVWNFTFQKAQKRIVNAALSNTFGFGGHNACVIVKKYK
jgi:3-oxoacyl-[acyl-carrier-protein] synthase II